MCHCNHHLFDKDRLEENTSCVSTSEKTFFSWPAPSTLLSTSRICFFGFFWWGWARHCSAWLPAPSWLRSEGLEQKYFCQGNEHTSRCGGVDSSLLEVFLLSIFTEPHPCSSLSTCPGDNVIVIRLMNLLQRSWSNGLHRNLWLSFFRSGLSSWCSERHHSLLAQHLTKSFFPNLIFV